WAALAKANLLGVALPEEVGGSGLGLEELCLLLEQVGGAVAPIPAWPTLVLGALPIAAFGSPAQRERWLPPVASGQSVLTAALVERPGEEPAAPQARAVRDGADWRLDGTKDCVPAAHLAAAIVVPAATGDGRVGVFLVEPGASGVTLERQVATNKEPQARLTLAGARVAADGVLGDPALGCDIVEWLLGRALPPGGAAQLGAADRPARLTAQYTTERRQFDRPIGSFQAVQQRAADAWIDVEAIRLTMWQAAWRLAQGLPAREELLGGEFWAAGAGPRLTYAPPHLHGGIGVEAHHPTPIPPPWWQ